MFISIGAVCLRCLEVVLIVAAFQAHCIPLAFVAVRIIRQTILSRISGGMNSVAHPCIIVIFSVMSLYRWLCRARYCNAASTLSLRTWRNGFRPVSTGDRSQARKPDNIIQSEPGVGEDLEERTRVLGSKDHVTSQCLVVRWRRTIPRS